MFEQVAMAPPDAILGLTEAFVADSNPNKMNLSVGVYKDASGLTPVLQSVKEAERRLIESEPRVVLIQTDEPIAGFDFTSVTNVSLVMLGYRWYFFARSN